ncbi:unnamed protein product [Brassicogethes aeneus]|uniref:VWFA domain-containing protein n=1 Tax=Brassicogethes aeneus TaxID=1431903 RepID=A0A9P0AMA4_BRAAE|nr:unnamed protein product [Brassicogethes aeneus]
MASKKAPQVVETTVFCLDNSDFTLNEDFLPNRLQAQCEGINLIMKSKTVSNPSNYFGLVAMANASILVPLTQNFNDILDKFLDLSFCDDIDLVASLHMAYTMLTNKDGIRKILAFIASPCDINEVKLNELKKILKVSDVGVDIILLDQNSKTLKIMFDFTTFLNADDDVKRSKVVFVYPDTNINTALKSSDILPVTYITNDVDEDEAYFIMALNLSLQEKHDLDAYTPEEQNENVSNDTHEDDDNSLPQKETK